MWEIDKRLGNTYVLKQCVQNDLINLAFQSFMFKMKTVHIHITNTAAESQATTLGQV